MVFRRGKDEALRLGEPSYSPSSVCFLDKYGTSQENGHSSSYERHHSHTEDGVEAGYSGQEVYDIAPWQADALSHALDNRADSFGSLQTEGRTAGNGSNGTFIGAIVDSDIAISIPLNIAINAYGGKATATQIDNVINHHSGQMAWAGNREDEGKASGGDHAAAIGSPSHTSEAAQSDHAGSLSLHPETASIFGSAGHAGNGGGGIFLGAMLDIDVAVYAPINIAIGFGGNVTAIQYNSVVFDQGADQVGGIGGQGGNGNGAVGDSGFWSLLHADIVHTGGGSAGNGGDGVFVGIMNDNDVGIYAPVNIAIGASAIDSAGSPGELHCSSDWPSGVMGGYGGLDLNHGIEMLIDDLIYPT